MIHPFFKVSVLSLGLLLAVAAPAQETNAPEAAPAPPARPVQGFRLPEYDVDGTLIRQFQGETATFMKDGIIQFTGLDFEVYEKGSLALRATSPFTAYDQPRSRAASRESIRIVADKLVISGNGFAWNGETEQFQIFNNVRVVLDSQMDAAALLDPNKESAPAVEEESP